jgi:hypothetical protein
MKTTDLRTLARVATLAIMATGLAGMTPAQAFMTENALTQNALTQNALTQNALTQNALTQNALTSTQLATSFGKGAAASSASVEALNGVAVESVILPISAH